ncbi:hypothetical protein D8Y22_06205 [Salinadaptatus halalkaliphilus]|uniref:histidine kinase n=1 Tax=Salinadaptatus halalkaliphilus TaxID=2419781 RepID=A0A4S3TNJ6_9EURY|nr:ATP-binding protein [Salinadaptatus halalkaliphilus]THE65756.1 hypothetical protein D8Y22_06205 [Salinadaptatus halalkaliphilus]
MIETAVAIAVGAVGLAGAGLYWTAALGATRPDRPGRAAFVLVAGLLATAAVGAVGGHLVGLEVTDARWHLLVRVPVYLAIGPWLVFVFQFTGRGTHLTGWRTVALMSPIALFTVSLTGQTLYTWLATELLETPGTLVAGTPVASRLTVVVISLGLVVYALAFTGLVALLQTSYTSPQCRPGVAGVLCGAMFGPLLPSFVAWSASHAAGSMAIVGTYAVGFCLSAGCLWLALTRFGVFDSSAVAAGTVARRTLPAELDDLIVVVDDRERIVDYNAATRETLDLAPAAAIGTPLEDVCDSPTDDLTRDGIVTLETADGPRRFDLQTSELGDGQQWLGRVLSFRDVTRRELREQRIRILNRVLRHNLRNKLSIVRGNAERVPMTDEPAAVADEIQAASDELLALGEKARAIESVLSSQQSYTGSTNVAPIVEAAVEDARGANDVEIEYSIETTLALEASGRALEYLVTELIENAIEHVDGETPRLEVTIGGTDRRGRLSVADNGPGIPEDERTAIQEGEESALVHGSGLGLWGVRWVVTLLGGEMQFVENEPRGTVVRIDLPRVDTSPSQPSQAAEAVQSR